MTGTEVQASTLYASSSTYIAASPGSAYEPEPASSPPSLPYDPDPITPTDPPASTPALAGSPDTPYPYARVTSMGSSDEQLQTPQQGEAAEGKGKGANEGVRIVRLEEVGQAEDGVGLGFGDVGAEMKQARGGDGGFPVAPQAMRRGNVGSSPRRSAATLEAAEHRVDSREQMPTPLVQDFPSISNLYTMKESLKQLEGGAAADSTSGSQDELIKMVKTLLEPAMTTLPFMYDQLAAQRETIRTLQAQAKLSHKLVRIERDRHAAERQSWRITLDALGRQRESDVAGNLRQKGLLDVNMGYHEELEAANKRLEMENRLMGPRLADTQQQVDRLVAELRHLRSHVVLSTEPFTHPPHAPPPASASGFGFPPGTPLQLADPFIAAPLSVGRSRSPVKSTVRLHKPSPNAGTTLGSAAVSMGDARTEHLLLAARKVRAMRQANPNVGKLTMDELRKHGVQGPDGGVGYREGYAGVEDSEEGDEGESELEDRAFSVMPPSASVAIGHGTVKAEDAGASRVGGGSTVKARRASWSGKRNRGGTATPLARPRAGRAQKDRDADEVPSAITAAPATAGPQAKGRKARAPVTPSSKRSGPRQAPHTTPGGNFNDLLRAAELATRPTTPTRETRVPHSAYGMGMPSHRASHSLSHVHTHTHQAMHMPAGAMSATRSTTRRGRGEMEGSDNDDEGDRDDDGAGEREAERNGSPTRKARRVGSLGVGQLGLWRSSEQSAGAGGGPRERVVSGESVLSTGSNSGAGKTALDLLLQASQIESRHAERQAVASASLASIPAEGAEGRSSVGHAGSGGLEPAFELSHAGVVKHTGSGASTAMADSRSSSAPTEEVEMGTGGRHGGDGDGDVITPKASNRRTSADSAVSATSSAQADPRAAGKGAGTATGGRGKAGMSRASRPAPIRVAPSATSTPNPRSGQDGARLDIASTRAHPPLPASHVQAYPYGNGSHVSVGANIHTPARHWVNMPSSSPFDDTARLPPHAAASVSTGRRGSVQGATNHQSAQAHARTPMQSYVQQDQRQGQAQMQVQTPRMATPANGVRANGSASTASGAKTPGRAQNGNGSGAANGNGNGTGTIAFDSPTGAPVPGLGKYAHLTSSMPARRVRSPYLKWTVEEDELLARAVAIHGEKWDLVSKGVPTRSYHQVRQRWLRKTGAFDKKGVPPGTTAALASIGDTPEAAAKTNGSRSSTATPNINNGQFVGRPEALSRNSSNDAAGQASLGGGKLGAAGSTLAPSLINGVGMPISGGQKIRLDNRATGDTDISMEGDVGDDAEAEEMEMGAAMQRSNSPTPAPGAKAGKGRRGSLSLV